MPSVFNTNKGRRVDQHDTICGTLRSAYDTLVCGLHGKDDRLLAEVTPILERAALYAIKMNKRLCELKVDTMEMFPDPSKESPALRQERVRLQAIIEKNERDLNASRQGQSVLDRR